MLVLRGRARITRRRQSKQLRFRSDAPTSARCTQPGAGGADNGGHHGRAPAGVRAAMRPERQARAQRCFAGEPQARRSPGEALESKQANQQAQPPPGRSTLADSLEPALVDAARVIAAQIELAERQLAVLEAANRAGGHRASAAAASAIRAAFRIAERAVARTRSESEECVALAVRLAGVRSAARAALEQAFTPSPAAKREVIDGAGWARWDGEVAAWRARRGCADPDQHRGAGAASGGQLLPRAQESGASPLLASTPSEGDAAVSRRAG